MQNKHLVVSAGIVAFVGLGMAILGCPSHADTVFTNETTPQAFDLATIQPIYPGNDVSQAFTDNTPGDYNLTSIIVPLAGPDPTFSLYTGGNGASGTLLASFDISAEPEFYEAEADYAGPPVVLSYGSTYTIVATSQNSNDLAGWFLNSSGVTGRSERGRTAYRQPGYVAWTDRQRHASRRYIDVRACVPR